MEHADVWTVCKEEEEAGLPAVLSPPQRSAERGADPAQSRSVETAQWLRSICRYRCAARYVASEGGESRLSGVEAVGGGGCEAVLPEDEPVLKQVNWQLVSGVDEG